MEVNVHTLQDLFKIGYEAYEASREEAAEVLNLFHNRQYTEQQLGILKDRGQPAETFNVIKFFGRLLLGHYSTIVNTIKLSPKQYDDILTTALLNDIVTYTLENNQFESEGDKIKLDGILQGLMCVYIDVEDTKEKDQFGRVLRKVTLSHVPAEEIILDPLSSKEDYSDGRFMHRFKWVSEDDIIKLMKSLGTPKPREVLGRLAAYDNHVQITEGDFEYKYGTQFTGKFKRYDNYLVVHSIIQDDDDRVWSVFWSADEELGRKEVTYKEVKFPYRIQKIHTSNKVEYYGIFREIVQSQHAINQALLKIQLMVNSQKAFVEKNAVENIAEFTKQFNRVNAVIEVNSLSKIKIENLSSEVIDQYTIIDKALTRIQRTLGINDSFLGMAFASDSGRKVKLQQNQTTLALRYFNVRIDQFYRLMGWDVVNLVKQYYTAYQATRIADNFVGARWIELNKPMQTWTGQFDEAGQPVMDYVWDYVIDPASGEPMKDEKGNLIVAPLPSKETEIAFTNVDISIDSVVYNDEEEKSQLMLETILQGNIGQVLSTVNMPGFLKAASLAVKGMKSRRSIDIAEILDQTAMMIAQGGVPQQDPNAPPPQMQNSRSPKSSSLKLPQNTNEE